MCIGHYATRLYSISLLTFELNKVVYFTRFAQVIARLCVHGKVTALRVCHDTRTVLVGCEDGTLLSYVIIDLPTDAACHQSILQSLGTRQAMTSCDRQTSSFVASGLPSRAWDKVDGVAGTVPNYCRPPSAILPTGPSDKLALGLVRGRTTPAADAGAETCQQQQLQQFGTRRVSSSQLYRLNYCRSQTCNVM